MKAEYGICLVCEKQLMHICPTCSAKRPNDQYAVVEMKLNNGSRMKIAACMDCKDKIYEQNKTEIMNAVKDGWRAEQVRDKWPPEKMQEYEIQFGRLAIE